MDATPHQKATVAYTPFLGSVYSNSEKGSGRSRRSRIPRWGFKKKDLDLSNYFARFSSGMTLVRLVPLPQEAGSQGASPALPLLAMIAARALVDTFEGAPGHPPAKPSQKVTSPCSLELLRGIQK